MVGGVSANDFLLFPLVDHGVDVTLNRVTKTTSNLTGDRTLSYGGNVTITVVFLKRNTIRDYEKDGLVERADGYIMVKPSDAVLRGDKITKDGDVFRVEKVDERKFKEIDMFHMCSLHKI